MKPSTLLTLYCSSQSLLTRRQLKQLKNVAFMSLYKFSLSILDDTLMLPAWCDSEFWNCCILSCLVCIVVSCLVCIVVDVLCEFLLSYVYLLYYVCTAVFTLDAGLLARSQYSEGPATGHLDTGFSWFPFVSKQMLRWFPRFQVAITCFSCSPPDLNLVVTNFIFCIHVK